MKEVTIKLYQIDELSDKAKRRAVNWYLSEQNDYPYSEEASKSLRAFLEYWNSTVGDYYFADGGMKPKLTCCPTYNRREIILKLDNLKKDDGLTGYYHDLPLVEGFAEAFANMNDDMETLLDAAINKWWDEVVADYEYLQSDESVEDILMSNDYWFTIDGNYCDHE